MLVKSAVFATVLAAAAATMSLTATAAPVSAPGTLNNQEQSQTVQKVRWGGHTYTKCVAGKRLLVTVNRRGNVVSRRVVGRCWHPSKNHRHHNHHRRHWH